MIEILAIQWRRSQLITQLSHLKNGLHFTDDRFKLIFINETFYILIRISLRFVSKGQIDNKSALIQVH